MKILWISHLLPYPPVGGARIRSYNLLKEVGKSNDLHFLGLYQKSHQKNPEDVNVGITQLKKFCITVTVYPFESYTHRFSWYFLVLKSFFSNHSYKEYWCNSKQLIDAIKNTLSEQSIDLVHFDTISLLQYSHCIPQNIPIAINHHNIESSMLFRRAEQERNLLKKIYFKWEAVKIRNLEIQYCKKGVNLVVSELDEKRLHEVDPFLKTEIIPNGVNIDYLRRTNGEHIENSLIFVGGLTWYPNIDAVTYFCKEIWPLLKKKVPDAKFYIIGRNPPDQLKDLIKYENNIIVMGYVDDIRPIMSSVSGYVCPMRDGGGTRLKVLDALAMGVPLIATRMACEGIPVEDGKHVLLADTPEDFVNKIIQLFNSSTLREKLRKYAGELIEDQFNFSKIGTKLNNCYVQAVKD